MMYRLIFKISQSFIKEVELFCENNDIQNFCVFECPEYGASSILDNDGIPIALVFSVDLLIETNSEATRIKKQLTDYFKCYIFDITLEKVKECDWVSINTSNQKPFVIENFLFYNPYILTPIKMNASLAFGSGDHPTTKGCVSMISYLNKHRFEPTDVLDMGCGSGILSICSSKTWKSIKNITAIDIEECAVQIAKNNFKDNDVVGQILRGSDVSCFKDSNCIDLILCNILKKTLEELAIEFFRILKPEGMIIISGFLTSQYAEINSCYTNNGFNNMHEIEIEKWLTVLYKAL
jgi:ribosomal protein L11 methyltransferase